MRSSLTSPGRLPATAVVAVVGLLLLLILPSGAHGFVFELASGTERCFIQEIASDTDLRLVYNADPAYGDFIDVIMTNPDGVPEFQRMAKDSDAYVGRTQLGGEYTFCITSRQGAKSTKQKRSVLLVIQMGADTKDYASLVTKDKMRPMEVQMRVMEDTVQEVHKEFLYLRAREAEMRSTNEHMTSMVMWMSILLIALFGIFWYLQLRHLKRYFKKKRMID